MQGHIFESGVTLYQIYCTKKIIKFYYSLCSDLNYKILQFVAETAIKAFVFTLSER